MLEFIDRKRSGEAALVLEYKEDEEGLTPLMLAAKLNWKEGAFELLRNEASMTTTNNAGKNAKQIAEKHKCKSVLLMFEEFFAVDDGTQEETQAMRRKREDIEKSQQRRAEESQKKESEDIAAKNAKFDDHYKLEFDQKEAASFAKWGEVAEALKELSTEVKIVREDGGDQPKEIDEALWKCKSLKIVRIRLPKGQLVSIAPSISGLINLTELIVSHNSLVEFPKEIGTLTNLKALEAEGNQLESLPDELSNCTQLEVVNVTGNKLTSLKPLTPLTELLSILASQNAITDLDIELETKTHLRVLAVGNNQLTSLPAGIGALLQMKEFDAKSNLLEDLPTEMSALSEKKLLTMRLEDNKFKDRKIKSILEKSVKPVKEITNHLANRGDGGGGGKKKGKKKK